MRLKIETNATPQPTSCTSGKGRGFLRVLLFAILLSSLNAFSAISVTLNQAPGGIALLTGANYRSSFGEMNALAIGTPQTGVTAVACPANCSLGNGALYFSEVQVVANGLSVGQTGVVKAYVRTDFTGNAGSAMNIYYCPATSVCTSPNNYSALPTTAAGEITVATGLTSTSTTATMGLAIFLPDNNGATAFTNNNASAQIQFDLFINGSGVASDNTRLTLNNPNENVDNAIQLTLAQAPSGLAISAGSDYTMDFGNVNALGIGATIPTVAQAGGIIYSTPYQLLPVFTDQAATTSSLKVCVSNNFVNSSVLGLWDSSTGGAGTFTAISTACPNVAFTTTAADRSTVTRYLGLFVSNINGPTAYSGTDSATLTFTMTVP